MCLFSMPMHVCVHIYASVCVCIGSTRVSVCMYNIYIYTLLTKKVVTPQDDVSSLRLFLFHQSARSKDRLFGEI